MRPDVPRQAIDDHTPLDVEQVAAEFDAWVAPALDVLATGEAQIRAWERSDGIRRLHADAAIDRVRFHLTLHGCGDPACPRDARMAELWAKTRMVPGGRELEAAVFSRNDRLEGSDA